MVRTLHFHCSGLSSVPGDVLSHFSRVQLFVTPWTVRPHGLWLDRVLLSMGFSSQEYWSGLPFPTLGDLPDPGIEHLPTVSAMLAGGFFTTEPPGKPHELNVIL